MAETRPDDLPPEDVEWEDGTRGHDLPPPEVEQELSEGEADAPAAEAPPAAVSEEVTTPPINSQPAAPRPPPADPGFLRSAGRGLLQGFFKQGADEAAGAIAALGTDVMPGARYKTADGTTRPIQSSGDVYRAVRDTERDIGAGASEHRPVLSFLTNMAGDVASDAVLGALGVPVASAGYQAASGALSGVMGSDAELTSDGGGEKAALASGVMGGALGFLAPKVGTAFAQHLPGGMARFRAWLEEQAIDKARRVLTNGVDLNPKQPLPDAAVREALDAGAIDVWGTTKGAFQKLEQLAEERGAIYGDIIDRLKQAGVEGPRTEGIARELMASSLDSAENSGANKAVARAFAAEADNVRAVAPPEFNLLGEYTTPINLNTPAPATKFNRHGPDGRFLPKSKWVELVQDAPPPAPAERVFTPFDAIPGPAHPRLELDQAERIKRALQHEAKYGRIEDTPINEAKKEIAAVYRKHIEDAVEEAGAAAPPGSPVAELASEFLPVKQQLANTLGARDVAMRGAARAAQRSGASGISLFDLANATTAAGTGGLPALALAGASRIWRERGPSTLANMYDVSAEAAGNFGRWAAANPELVMPAATSATGAVMRQLTSGLVGGGQQPPVNGGSGAQNLQRALMQSPDAFGPYAERLQAAAAQGQDALAMQDYMLAQTDPEYAERRKQALGAPQN